MKKLAYLAFVILIIIAFSACSTIKSEQEKWMVKTGEKIGNMTLEKHSMSTKYPDLWDYCAYQAEEKEPGTQTVDCDVPLIPILQISFGWGAKDDTILDANWSAMTWELYIDGYQIDINEIEQWSDSGRPDLGVYQSIRGWILDLNNLSPGEHTLRYLWTSEIPIDDGFDVYQPGVYEHVVNFTVSEK